MKMKIVAFLVFASFGLMTSLAFSPGYCEAATKKPAVKSTKTKASNKAVCSMMGGSMKAGAKGSAMKPGATCPTMGSKMKPGAVCPMPDAKGAKMKDGATCSMMSGNAMKAKTPAKKVVSAICPVMHNKIPNVTKAAGKSVYKGKTYYFCCPACKPLFDKNPAKYVKK